MKHRKNKMGRAAKSLISSLLVLFMLTTITFGAYGETASASQDTLSDDSFLQEFQQPDGQAKPYIRWWVVPGGMTEEETRKEVRMMADAGFSGIELVSLASMASFGSSGWNEAMKWALEEAIACGITLDFTIGEGWPIATPAVDDNDHILSEQGLFYKNVDFTATSEQNIYSESILPFPDRQFDINRPYELVAVTAAQNTNNVYDSSTAIDITDSVSNLEDPADITNAVISWEAPAEGDWTIFYLYRQAITTASQWGASDPIIDHFSKDAALATVNYWDESLMAGEMKDLYEQNGGSIFCDSLEIGQASKDTAAFWTPNLLNEFENRRGYDLTPYLPALFIESYYPYYSHAVETDAEPDFNFDSVGYQIREDFYKTLTELFTENHVSVFKDWANSHNMTLRYQVYGTVIEVTEPTLEIDYVETESWGHKDILDMYRTQSGAVHMTGSGIYSTESAAVINMAWAQTWTGSQKQDNLPDENGYYWPADGSNNVYRNSGNEDAGMLYHLNRQYVTGVNRVVMHGFSYKSSTLYSWPGDSYMAMGGFPNEWDDKTPMWNHIDLMTDYVSRTQYILQQGQADIDLAIYRKYNYEGYQAFDFSLNPIERAGYTYDFTAPAIFELDNAVVTSVDNTPVLAADGPSYKALIIDQRNLTDGSGGKTYSSMPFETAEKILTYAEAGLPIILVGNGAEKVDTFAGSAEKMNDLNNKLADIIAKIAAAPSSITVESQDKVPDALNQLGIHPDLKKEKPSDLLGFHRNDSGADYYFIYNSNMNEALTETISLKGIGTPYILDAWSGDIVPIAEYAVNDEYISFDVSLKPNAAIIVALTKDTWTGAIAPKYSVNNTDADSAVYGDDNELAIRTTDKGNYQIEFSNFQTANITVSEDAQNIISLDDWTLNMESWSQESILSPLQTKKESLEPISLNKLTPWNEIDGLETAVGVGTYTTAFDLDKGWDEGQGAFIDFTRVSDTMKLYVNGTQVIIDQTQLQADIGSHLVQGTNEIKVEVVSNLANKKAPGFMGNNHKQEFGMIGEVTVTPYIYTSVDVPEKPDTSGLESIIKKAEDLMESDEFKNAAPSLQNNFIQVLENAREVYANARSTQDDIDSAVAALQKAIDELLENGSVETNDTEDDTGKESNGSTEDSSESESNTGTEDSSESDSNVESESSTSTGEKPGETEESTENTDDTKYTLSSGNGGTATNTNNRNSGKNKVSPKTGDQYSFITFMTILLTSGSALFLLGLYKSKKN